MYFGLIIKLYKYYVENIIFTQLVIENLIKY